MPRRGYRRIVIIPPSTDRTIVFPYNFSSRKFITQHYFPGMTNNAASSEEIGQFLTEVERRLQDYHKAAGHTTIKWMTAGIFLLFIAFFIAIPVSIVTSNTNCDSSSSSSSGSSYSTRRTSRTSSTSCSGFPIGIPIVFGILFCYMFFFIIMNGVFAARGQAKLNQIKEELSLFISQRATQFRERGLNWVIPVNFPYWIELWRTDSMQPMMPNFFNMGQMQQQQFGYANNSMGQPFNMYNASTDGMYVKPGDNSAMMMGQPMQMQMQPMQMQIQGHSQQGIYMQNQYGANTYGNTYGGHA